MISKYFLCLLFLEIEIEILQLFSTELSSHAVTGLLLAPYYSFHTWINKKVEKSSNNR